MNNFQWDQLFLAVTLDELKITRKGSKENGKAMAHLVEELDNCLKNGNLISVCQSFATMAIGKMSLKDELFKGGERPTAIEDVRAIYAGLHEIMKSMEGKNPSLEITDIKRARARVNYVVSLVYAAIHGGNFVYKEKVLGKNEVAELQMKTKSFRGVPLSRLPKKPDEKTDFRINIENVRKLYELLLALEKEETDIPLDSLPFRERIQRMKGLNARNGEADFFWNQLPNGLKEAKAPVPALALNA